jgi:predicted nucleic acid-binding protein
MSQIYRFSDFYKLYEEFPSVKNGFLVDTNFLISLTYDLSVFNEKSIELYQLLNEKGVSLFCNVNVRNEFLEVHRSIILTESLVSFYQDISLRELLPFELKGRLKSLITRRDKAAKYNKPPTKLSQTEIKMFAAELSAVEHNDKNIWDLICSTYLRNTLSQLWASIQNEFRVNFLSLRKNDHENYLVKEPEWEDAIKIIETYGIASSDAMIINMFLCTNFSFLITSDKEVANTIRSMNKQNKFPMFPNGIKLS